MSDIEQNGGLTAKDNTLSLAKHDMNIGTKCIYEMYAGGKSVPFIAAEIGKSEAYVYASMRRIPEMYADVKRNANRTFFIRHFQMVKNKWDKWDKWDSGVSYPQSPAFCRDTRLLSQAGVDR